MHTSLDSRKEEIEQRLLSKESLRSIAKSMNLSYQTLQYHRRIWGSPPLRKTSVRGSKHASWSGGEFTDKHGYKMIRSPRRNTRSPYTPEHILVAEKQIGRPLEKGEHVHHLNGDKLDNSPSNLLVCLASRHRISHRQLEEIAMNLVRSGQIVFDGNQYILNPQR